MRARRREAECLDRLRHVVVQHDDEFQHAIQESFALL
jgi:hypothetical protein